MAEHGAHRYPPVGDPDRLDSIMRRGRSLRRRRRAGIAGAGLGGVAVVLAVGALAFSGGDAPVDQDVVADDGTTTTESTTTTTAPPVTTGLSVEVRTATAQVVVTDPAQPDGADTQQCIYVRVVDPAATDPAAGAVAEGTACAPGLSAAGSVELTLGPTTPPGTDVGGPVEIGCAAVVTRPAPEDVASDAVAPGSTTFTLSAPALEPGTYDIQVSAVSGIGDGCEPAQPELEREHVAQGAGTVELL